MTYIILSVSVVLLVITGCTPKPFDPPNGDNRQNIPVSSPTATPFEQTASPSSFINGDYISYKLKVKFNVNTKAPEKAWVKEEGNKIYVVPGDVNTKYTEGQWLEVFTKQQNEEIKTAMQKQFLTGISEKDCFIDEYRGGVGKESTNSRAKGYQYYFINYPGSDNFENWNNNKCPEQYRATNGIRYFVYDPKHPTRYVYLDIGQYPIMSGVGENIVWQDTLRFID